MKKLLTKLIFFTYLSTSILVSKSQDTACLNQLIPCLQYINSTRTPSTSCCTPLKSLIESDPVCLCNILGSNSVTKQAGVNSSKAIKLPQRCGAKVNVSFCKSSQKQRNTVTSSTVEVTISKAIAIIFLVIETIWFLID
ncbi:hypothetical protein LUZ60_016365 [Juncus effusus]|nr:hypothetical protein LUZ60_016365 [Juncus effusus]